MKTALLILFFCALAACFLGIAHCIKMLIRNEKVSKFRNFIIDNHYEIYHQLPDYDEMMRDGKPLKLESYIDISDLNI